MGEVYVVRIMPQAYRAGFVFRFATWHQVVYDLMLSYMIFLRLPHGDDRAGRIHDHAQPAMITYLHDILQHGGAQIARLVGGGLNVVHADIRQPV